ncbi:MAG: hypothetical protein PHC53_03065 [Patescibacteria group bacterium]|nr:hypothetical protein [Patescibacteria group bacterium]
MTKIAPGGDHMSDASQQSAQQMVQAAKVAKAAKEAADPSGSSEVPRMKLATTKIVHTPETPADYAKRVMIDKELRNIKPQAENT